MASADLAPRGQAIPRLDFRVPLDPSRLTRARERVRDYLGLYIADHETVEQIVLCVEEACTNAIRHSRAHDDLELALWFDGHDLHGIVRDTGTGFDPLSIDTSRPPDPIALGGRGLFLIHRLMDRVAIRRAGGTELHMVRRDVLSEARRYNELLARGAALESLALSDADAWTPRMRAILEDISEGMVAIDWEYRVIYLNRAAEPMVRSTRERLVGHSVWEAFPDLRGTDVERRLRDAMESGWAGSFEYYYPRLMAWFEVRVYPTSAGISLYLRRIDERKRVEHERERLLVELAERARFNDALGELGGEIASVRDPAILVARLTEITGRSLDAAAGVFEVHEPEGWAVRHAWGAAEHLVGAVWSPEAAPLAEQAYRLRRTIAIEDVRLDEQPSGSVQALLAAKSMLTVALVFAGEGVGVLSFFWTDRRHAFSQAEIDFVDRAAAETSVAARNLAMFLDTRRAHELSEALNAVNEAVMSSLDAQEILDRVAAEAAAALDATTAWISRFSGGTWSIVSIFGGPSDIVGTTFSSADAPLSEELRRTLRPAAMSEVPAGSSLGPRGLEVKAVVAAPLLIKGVFFGALYLGFARRRSFAELEVDFARKCAGAVAAAIENARLYEIERGIARGLQAHFIHPVPDIEGIEFGVVDLPAASPALVGGDFYDVFVVDERRVMVLIGDVSGKGVSAAGLTETVRSTVRAFALVDPSPGYVLGMTGRALLRHEPDDTYVTAFLLLLDLSTGETVFANAGHPPPLRIGPLQCGYLNAVPGPPLGTFPTEYPEDRTVLQRTETVMLFTDGATEARDGVALFGYDRLLRIACDFEPRRPQGLVEDVRDTIGTYATLKDDMQLVAFRLT